MSLNLLKRLLENIEKLCPDILLFCHNRGKGNKKKVGRDIVLHCRDIGRLCSERICRNIVFLFRGKLS